MVDDTKPVSKHLIWDSTFTYGVPTTFRLNFIKLRATGISAFLVKHNLLKIRWKLVGFIINAHSNIALNFLVQTIQDEFPTIKIIRKNHVEWEEGKNIFRVNGGSEEIFLDFLCEADEAEFVIRGDNVIDALKGNEALIRLI